MSFPESNLSTSLGESPPAKLPIKTGGVITTQEEVDQEESTARLDEDSEGTVDFDYDTVESWGRSTLRRKWEFASKNGLTVRIADLDLNSSKLDVETDDMDESARRQDVAERSSREEKAKYQAGPEGLEKEVDDVEEEIQLIEEFRCNLDTKILSLIAQKLVLEDLADEDDERRELEKDIYYAQDFKRMAEEKVRWLRGRAEQHFSMS
ncbi:hypothetical protein NHQ30_004048 [Ciborinia camelliae]|nr:hypothetical protein NHQ30_004048 [Ciborinia camelliae]